MQTLKEKQGNFHWFWGTDKTNPSFVFLFATQTLQKLKPRQKEPFKSGCGGEEKEEAEKEEGTARDSSEVHFNLHGSGRQEFSISSLSFSISLILNTPFSMLARPGPESERHTK